MKNDFEINLTEAPLTQETIAVVKSEVEKLCLEAGTSTLGFQIDHCFCDWGDVSTASVVSLIDGAGRKLGNFGSANYKKTVSYICEQVTEYFKS